MCFFIPGDIYEAERKKLLAKLFAQATSEDVPKKHGAFEVYRQVKQPLFRERAKVD